MNTVGHVVHSQPIARIGAYYSPDGPAPVAIEGSHDGHYPTLNVYLSIDAAKTLRDQLDAVIVDAILPDGDAS